MEIEHRRHTTCIPGLPDVSGFGHVLRRQSDAFRPHLHPGDLEIVYVATGRLHWWIEDSMHLLRGGDVFFTPPDTPHGSGSGLFEPGEIYWFTVRMPRRGRFRGIDPGGKLLHHLRTIQKRAFAAGDLLPQLLKRLFPLLVSGAGGATPSGQQAACWLEAALWEIVRQAEADDRSSTAVAPPIAAALQAIEEHLDNSLTLTALARIAGMSTSHFKQRFRRETGVAPGRYYLQRRVEKAAHAIATTDRPLVGIAADFGFSSSQYLATCVRRELGRTPSQLRTTG